MRNIIGFYEALVAFDDLKAVAAWREARPGARRRAAGWIFQNGRDGGDCGG